MRLTPQHRQTAGRLLLAAAVCLFSIHALFLLTENAAIVGEKRHLTQALQQVLPSDATWDNDMLATQQLLGGNMVYWACQDGQPRYRIVEISTKNGYNGLIKLLVSVHLEQRRIMRIHPLFHQETPGLGDNIEPKKSNWLQQFTQPLSTPQSSLTLRQDGGTIDSIAGATMTARAVTKAIATDGFQSFSPPAHPCEVKP